MAGYFDDEANVAAFEKRRKEWVAAHEDTASLLASKDARIAELERKLASAEAALDTHVRAQEHYREAMDERNTFKNAARVLTEGVKHG